jgi:hypothetical protein
MGKVTLVLVLVVVLAALGGASFLALWDFHVPQTQVEKVLPDARFPKEAWEPVKPRRRPAGGVAAA